MRLKPKDIKPWKAQHWSGFCDLCHEPLELDQAVADHDHSTGFMRGVLHPRCNSLEGVLSRGLKRFGFKSMPSFVLLTEYYNQARRFEGVYHPTFRTPEEKKLLAKKRRTKKRLKKSP